MLWDPRRTDFCFPCPLGQLRPPTPVWKSHKLFPMPQKTENHCFSGWPTCLVTRLHGVVRGWARCYSLMVSGATAALRDKPSRSEYEAHLCRVEWGRNVRQRLNRTRDVGSGPGVVTSSRDAPHWAALLHVTPRPPPKNSESLGKAWDESLGLGRSGPLGEAISIVGPPGLATD